MGGVADTLTVAPVVRMPLVDATEQTVPSLHTAVYRVDFRVLY